MNTIDFNDIIKIHYHNVSSSAIHKAYAVLDSKPVSDKSKNHFYTDLSIHKCNAPMTIGFISENVMCDNIYGTKLRYLVHLSAASNCIVANSALTADRELFDRGPAKNINENKGLYIQDACSCWFQNSYLNTCGRSHVYAYNGSDDHYHIMSIKSDENANMNISDKKYKRNFIGAGFDIPNHWFKFTGCKMLFNFGVTDYYFYEDINNVANSKGVAWPNTYQFGEYWDNCSLDTYTVGDLLRMYCINKFPGGLTVRNSYLKNINPNGSDKAPFRFFCWQEGRNVDNKICKLLGNCVHAQYDKWFSSLHLENNVFNKICNNTNNSWEHIFSPGGKVGSITNAISISNSYAFNCYKLSGANINQLEI